MVPQILEMGRIATPTEVVEGDNPDISEFIYKYKRNGLIEGCLLVNTMLPRQNTDLPIIMWKLFVKTLEPTIITQMTRKQKPLFQLWFIPMWQT